MTMTSAVDISIHAVSPVSIVDSTSDAARPGPNPGLAEGYVEVRRWTAPRQGRDGIGSVPVCRGLPRIGCGSASLELVDMHVADVLVADLPGGWGWGWGGRR